MSGGAATAEWDDTPGGGWPVVPGYEIVAVLGRGGMGVVYEARDVRAGVSVALKVLHAGAGPRERARFRVEAAVTTRLRHPNVVAVTAAREHEGMAYLVMELVPGGGLDRRLAAGPLPPREAAELVRDVARAVQFAHDAGVVHRDLKPGNILLGPTGPKVADFGLAKRLDPDATALTRDGAVLGSPSYMAPEQAAGSAEIGPAADVYGLGAVLYECLTGRPPFRADTWEATLAQVLRGAPTPPALVNPAVPAALEAVCLRCLEKEPDRRYPRADAVAADLDRALAGEPTAAAPLTPGERRGRVAAADGFTLHGEVGRGPHAVVYRAAGAVGPALAVKVFEPGAAPRGRWQEWLDGPVARWAAVAHPHVLAPVRWGWWGDAPYVAREFLPLGSVAAQTGGAPQPVAAALRLVVRLAEVVGYLHRQGLVHANLKPSNVLLAADDIPRLADPRPPGALVTGGEAGYVAPELTADPATEPRPHADVYGLAALLYGLLTGRPPDPCVPPSAVQPGVPVEVDRVCTRALHPNPWHRPTRAYDLLRRLRPLLAEAEAADAGRRPKRL